MTIGGWLIYFGIVAVIGCIFGCVFCCAYEKKTKIVAFIITISILALALMFMLWWYNNTESGKRAFKTQESNLTGGIEREVSVYDVEGELIKSYSGKFDVVYDNDRILFDDENGKRHVIYYPTGTVIIDER